MRGTVLYGPRDIRFEDRETPKIVEPIARWTSAVQSRRCCARSDKGQPWTRRNSLIALKGTPFGEHA
jgi:hypothetical protein